MERKWQSTLSLQSCRLEPTSNLHISLDRTVLNPGDTVNGVVRLKKNVSTDSVKYLAVFFEGKGFIFIDGGKRVTRKHFREFMNFQEVVGKRDGNKLDNMVGVPFRFRIPEGIPGSAIYRTGPAYSSVQYYFKAVLKMKRGLMWKEKQVAMQPLKVQGYKWSVDCPVSEKLLKRYKKQQHKRQNRQSEETPVEAGRHVCRVLTQRVMADDVVSLSSMDTVASLNGCPEDFLSEQLLQTSHQPLRRTRRRFSECSIDDETFETESGGMSLMENDFTSQSDLSIHSGSSLESDSSTDDAKSDSPGSASSRRNTIIERKVVPATVADDDSSGCESSGSGVPNSRSRQRTCSFRVPEYIDKKIYRALSCTEYANSLNSAHDDSSDGSIAGDTELPIPDNVAVKKRISL